MTPIPVSLFFIQDARQILFMMVWLRAILVRFIRILEMPTESEPKPILQYLICKRL